MGDFRLKYRPLCFLNKPYRDEKKGGIRVLFWDSLSKENITMGSTYLGPLIYRNPGVGTWGMKTAVTSLTSERVLRLRVGAYVEAVQVHKLALSQNPERPRFTVLSLGFQQ